MTEDEMVGWHHRLNGHRFGQTLGVGDGQGGLASRSPWGRKESDMTERLNSTEVNWTHTSMHTIFTEAVHTHSHLFTHHRLQWSNAYTHRTNATRSICTKLK